MSQVRASRILQIVPWVLVLALLCPCSYGRTIYVDAAAADSGNGSSWKNAYKYLWDALAEAKSAGRSVEIRVAQGVYKPDRDATHPWGHGLESVFEISGDVALRGGFAGPKSPDPNARDARTYPSVLSGDLEDNDVDGGYSFDLLKDPTRTDNLERVVKIPGPGSVLLEGFVITGGNVDFGGMIIERPWGFAGVGVSISGGDATVKDCTIKGNHTDWVGGGIAVVGAHARVVGCTFVSNVALEGGGVSLQGSEVELIQCVFSNNRAWTGGGLAVESGTVSLTGCIISGNKAQEGGGAIWATHGHVSMSNCVVLANSVLSKGAAAIQGRYGAIVTVSNSILWQNRNALFPAERLPVRADDDATIDLTYCDIQGDWPGDGNIDADPLFAKLGQWNANGTPDDPNDDFWVNGDCHLKSKAGRWDPIGEVWVKDNVTSPCIDAGDPNSPVGEEPFPNGGRVNLGAYGGTAEASKSLSGVQAKYGGGTGEPGSPYYIYTAAQMAGIGAEPGDWSKHFKLMADIDLSGYTGARLAVIGTDESNPLSGVFDGNGHTISGFTRLSAMVSHDAGLFGYVAGTIKNLGLLDPNVSGEFAPYVGALVRENHGTLAGCFAERAHVAGGDYLAGGLVGRNEGTMLDCHATGTVSGSSAGGLVAMNRGTIQGCWSAATVTGRGKKVGGLAGDNAPGTITNCYATGVVVTGDDQTGGLIGDNSYGTVTGSYSTGSVTGNDGVGGLVGQSWDGRIINCYSAAEVTGDRIVGGLLGANTGTVQNCYATGRASSNRWPCAGLVAWRSGGEVLESFWDIETSERDWSEGGVGKTTTEMQKATTFLAAGWDFVGEKANGTEDIWQIREGQDYPHLSWEAVTGAKASSN